MTRGPNPTPPAPVPEEISLPDGRRFRVEPLLQQVRDRVNINRLTGRPRTRGQEIKYTPEQREWICQATFEQIADRYAVTPLQARGIRNYNRQVLGYRQAEHSSVNTTVAEIQQT
jgi:hypothetical protein